MDWEDFFFSNAGGKIKSIICGIFRIEVILTLIAGIIMELIALINLICGNGGVFFLRMLAIPVGAALSIGALWLFTLMLYGFGEIVDTAITNRLTSDGEAQVVAEAKPKQSLASYFSSYKAGKTAPSKPGNTVGPTEWTCTCGKVNPAYMSSCSCGKTAREIREMNKQ